MLTRGLCLEVFKLKLEFWLFGLKWIQSLEVVWPTNDLKCLTAENKSIVLYTSVGTAKPVQPIVPFNRFSKFNKLVGATAIIIGALNKWKLLKDEVLTDLWGTVDARQCAKVHLFRIMQRQRFSDEICPFTKS